MATSFEDSVRNPLRFEHMFDTIVAWKRSWSDSTRAIDGLAALDPDTLTDGELHDAIVAVQRQRAKLGAVAAGLLSRWEHRGVWAGDGSRNAASRLAHDTRTSLTSANLELRRARAVANDACHSRGRRRG